MKKSIMQLSKIHGTIEVWFVGTALLALYCLAIWGMFWSTHREEERWLEPLSPTEYAAHDQIAAAIKSGAAGIQFLNSLSKNSAVYEVKIWLDTNKESSLTHEGQSLVFKQKGRFATGRKGSIGGYDYEVKFSRPTEFILGFPEDDIQGVSELGFWLFGFGFVAWIYFGPTLLSTQTPNYDRAPEVSVSSSNNKAA